MMKKSILFPLTFLFFFNLMGQNKLLEKMMAAQAPTTIEFFSDSYLSDPISSFKDGDYNFYVKIPIKKAIAQKAGNYKDISLTLNWNGKREVYKLFKDAGRTMLQVAKAEGYLTFDVNLKNKEDAGLFWLYLQDAEEEDVTLEVKFKSGRNRNVLMAKGSITLALSEGKSDYIDFLMKDKADFVFNYSDKFNDSDLKNKVQNFFQQNNIRIYDFAWGERVAYTEKGMNYRRHSALVTYQGKDDKCYFSSLKLYTETPYPRSDYNWDGETVTFHNSELVPCDKIMQ